MDARQPAEQSDRSREPLNEVNPNEGSLLQILTVMPMNKNRFVTRAPPRRVMLGVRSPGIAILFWLCGCAYALAGAHVYVEYGLNVPRYVIDGVEQSVPRSGGDLHYLQYVFPWPRYKKGIVMLSGVLYGISFICIGNMAGNCINCALRLVEAANPRMDASQLNEGTIRGIAIVIAIFPCLIHAFSRRGGILLNNLLAFIKVFMLIFMIVATWVVAGGPSGVRGLPTSNIDKSTTSPNSVKEGKAHAQAFLSINVQERKNVAQEFFYIIFNAYPEGSSTNPKRYEIKRAINAFLAISSFGNIVVMTYTAARMKQEIAKQGFLPFTSFFAKNRDVSFGRFLMWLEGGERKSNNQPSKNGHPSVLQPHRYDAPKVAGNRKPRNRLFKFLNPSNHREKTPVGALVLHFTSCIILILATYNTSASNAYSVLSGLIAYLTSAWFGFFLALGILILHFRGPPRTQPAQTPRHHRVPNQGPIKRSWAQMTQGSVNPKLSIFCSFLYLVGNLYPIITAWIPPSNLFNQKSLAWWVVPVISWCVVAFSTLWFLGFIGVARYKFQRDRSEFVYLCEPDFSPAESSEYQQRSGSGGDLSAGEAAARSRHGGFVLSHETIYTGWEGTETEQLFSHRTEMTNGIVPPAQPVPVHGSGIRRRPVDPPPHLYEGTDFPEFSQNGAPVQEPEPVSDLLYAPVHNHHNGSEQGLT
ncbi:amino acid permease-domain-containing protein [Fusarium acuminatum]|uniref:Amino acid permease-domain-containing protein n=1 Tax=Fusarium acuminatum TaxID=5515 RepID=A0ABZ2WGX3_9HYPO